MAKFLAVTAALTGRAREFVTGKQEGALVVQYGLAVGVLAAVCIAAVTTLGSEIQQVLPGLTDYVVKVITAL
jgi:Flp pilus assembly pilin Flp